MKVKQDCADVGIIVGRFQINDLHEAHIDLINTVTERHDRVLIFLGNSPLRNTLNNPLDFRARRAMIAENFSDVEIHYINDTSDDEVWSKNLDKLIAEQLTPHQTVMLYGSRDSFLKAYKGSHKTCELEASTFVSATEVRKRVSNNYPANKDYRAGMIAATAHRFPTAYQCVDVAIINIDKNEMLLAKKPGEKLLRFIGGFSDPRCPSLEADARREVKEEASVEVGDPIYVGSTLVDDWRYRNEIDKIKTALFVAPYIYGKPEAGDDIAEVHWVSLKNLLRTDLLPSHRPLFDLLKEKVLDNKKFQDLYFVNNNNGAMP